MKRLDYEGSCYKLFLESMKSHYQSQSLRSLQIQLEVYLRGQQMVLSLTILSSFVILEWSRAGKFERVSLRVCFLLLGTIPLCLIVDVSGPLPGFHFSVLQRGPSYSSLHVVLLVAVVVEVGQSLELLVFGLCPTHFEPYT